MVEEYPDPEPQNDMEEVPPSSDRNQRAPDMQMGTEEGMKWMIHMNNEKYHLSMIPIDKFLI